MPFLVPFLVSALVGGFASSIVQGLVKLAISIGVGFVVYQGIDILLTNIMSHIALNFADAHITKILGLLKVDKCLNVLASAVAVKFTLKTTLGALKRLELK